jgi:ribosome-binding factor A
MTNHRPGRVGDRIREMLARLLREEVRDPRIGFVTVTDVDLASDLKSARVYVSMLGDDTEETLLALNRSAGFLQRGLARQGGLRFTPQLRFHLDQSMAGGFRVEQLLEEVRPDPSAEDEPLEETE